MLLVYCLMVSIVIISSRELLEVIETTSIVSTNHSVHTPLIQTETNETVNHLYEKTMSVQPQLANDDEKPKHINQVVKRRKESKGFDLMERICAFLKQQIFGIKVIFDF